MTVVHPMTGFLPRTPWPIRMGGATGRIGEFGPVRRDADGQPKWHYGVDWLCMPGQAVFAPFAGTVSRAGEQSGGDGYGQRIYLHDKTGTVQAILAHLSVEFVHAGQSIRAGHCVGLAGRSGNIGYDDEEVPTHLHFEVKMWNADRQEWVATDPVAWVSGVSV